MLVKACCDETSGFTINLCECLSSTEDSIADSHNHPSSTMFVLLSFRVTVTHCIPLVRSAADVHSITL